MDLSSWRSEFPVLEHKAYLISASLGPVSQRSRAYLEEYLDAGLERGARSCLVRGDLPPDGVAEALVLDARRLHPDEVALTNISIALSTIASCLDLSGDRRTVILSGSTSPMGTSGSHGRGRRAPRSMAPQLRRAHDPVEVRPRDRRANLVMVNRVLYRSSAIVDAKAVCAIARDRGALSFVDDYHGLGIVPLDLHDLGCDLYTAGVLKWMLGGPGLVFLYARRDLLPSLEPAITGWFAQRGRSPSMRSISIITPARRLEHGAPGARVLHRAGRDRHHLGGGTGRDPRPERRALRPSSPGRTRRVSRCARRRTATRGRRREREGRAGGESRHQLLARDVCTDYRATVCGSARTSSTPRRTSTAASTSSGGSSDRQRTTTGTRWGTLFMKPP